MGMNRLSVHLTSRLAAAMMLLLLIMTMLLTSAHAVDLFGKSSKSKFLPVDQAFQTIQKGDGNQLKVDFVVVPQHYIYKDRVQLKYDGKTLKPVSFSKKANFVNDPEFGRVAVFESNVTAVFNLPKTIKDKNTVKLKWQGCAKAGLCYPPVTEAVSPNLLKKKR